MDGAPEDSAYKNPQKTRQKPELRREDRAYERTRPRDSGEMVAEEDIPVCGMVIPAVFKGMRGRGAFIIKDEDLCNNKFSIKTICQREYKKGDNN